MTATLDLRAPAKVNLSLEVLARLPNGYHQLDTWMHKVSLFDHLSLRLTRNVGLRLSCADMDVPADESNLVHRAARVFYAEIGREPQVAITLKKKIPVAAGLGGGSSDCAATLQGLNHLYGKPLNRQRLMALGAGLGADVPFFLFPFPSARARGIGEQLMALPPLRDSLLVLVNPGIAVSTKWVFANLPQEFSGRSQLESWRNSPKTANYALTTAGKTYILGRALQRCLDFKLINDLEQVTIAKYPEILTIKEALLAQKSCGALMSGSGSTVFGLFRDKDDACSCAERLKVEYPHWRIMVTNPLDEAACSAELS